MHTVLLIIRRWNSKTQNCFIYTLSSYDAADFFSFCAWEKWWEWRLHSDNSFHLCNDMTPKTTADSRSRLLVSSIFSFWYGQVSPTSRCFVVPVDYSYRPFQYQKNISLRIFWTLFIDPRKASKTIISQFIRPKNTEYNFVKHSSAYRLFFRLLRELWETIAVVVLSDDHSDNRWQWKCVHLFCLKGIEANYIFWRSPFHQAVECCFKAIQNFTTNGQIHDIFDIAHFTLLRSSISYPSPSVGNNWPFDASADIPFSSSC